MEMRMQCVSTSRITAGNTSSSGDDPIDGGTEHRSNHYRKNQSVDKFRSTLFSCTTVSAECLARFSTGCTAQPVCNQER